MPALMKAVLLVAVFVAPVLLFIKLFMRWENQKNK